MHVGAQTCISFYKETQLFEKKESVENEITHVQSQQNRPTNTDKTTFDNVTKKIQQRIKELKGKLPEWEKIAGSGNVNPNALLMQDLKVANDELRHLRSEVDVRFV